VLYQRNCLQNSEGKLFAKLGLSLTVVVPVELFSELGGQVGLLQLLWAPGLYWLPLIHVLVLRYSLTRGRPFNGTSEFWRVNVTKIGTGAAKFKRAETFSRGSLGTSSKRCRAQILKKIKNMFDIEHAQNKLSSLSKNKKKTKLKNKFK
jgi:hypothetical protein